MCLEDGGMGCEQRMQADSRSWKSKEMGSSPASRSTQPFQPFYTSDLHNCHMNQIVFLKPLLIAGSLYRGFGDTGLIRILQVWGAPLQQSEGKGLLWLCGDFPADFNHTFQYLFCALKKIHCFHFLIVFVCLLYNPLPLPGMPVLLFHGHTLSDPFFLLIFCFLTCARDLAAFSLPRT